jgi:2-isopropylmalate synthase
MRVAIYDTTLRDGTQGENINFSVEDKIRIARKLDDFGIDYIEGGWPGSNPRDRDFFEAAKALNLKHAKMAAFGSTRHAKNKVQDDENVRLLLESQTPVVTIFGKSWNLHTERALRVTEEQNLEMIGSTVAYLKVNGREVIYDAEHFFDGYKSSRDFALKTLEAASTAGADILVLCDTNGGTLPSEVAEMVADVRKTFGGVIGIHTHNDSEVAVANAITAIELGCSHVQGTVNGYGERCGNSNLVPIIANLQLKLGHECVSETNLKKLTQLANYVADTANLQVPNGQAFVGRSAFAHKGGIHVSAVLRDASTYEHVEPEAVGNKRRVLVSDLSGRANIFYKLEEKGWGEKLDDDARTKLLARIKVMENDGYELEGAEGSFELLVRETLQPDHFLFELEKMSVHTEKKGGEQTRHKVEMVVKTRDGGQRWAEESSEGGPFDAMATALRKCLSETYPQVQDVRLTDYKVRVLDANKGTAAKVRVLVTWKDHKDQWTTVGVSDDVLEASWNALCDSLKLELLRLKEADGSSEENVVVSADSSPD